MVVSPRYFLLRGQKVFVISVFEHVCACVLLLTTIKENIVKQMELEKLVIHMEKNESGFPTSYHTQK